MNKNREGGRIEDYSTTLSCFILEPAVRGVSLTQDSLQGSRAAISGSLTSCVEFGLFFFSLPLEDPFPVPTLNL